MNSVIKADKQNKHSLLAISSFQGRAVAGRMRVMFYAFSAKTNYYFLIAKNSKETKEG